MQANMTEMFEGDFSRQLAKTAPGMAHLAGSGPDGKTCRECLHFDFSGYYSINGKNRGGLKPGRCAKYHDLMNRWGPAVPHRSRACKHFTASGSPKPPVSPI